MNKQAYEHTVGLVLSKKGARSAFSEAPVTSTSSLISSTPSSLVTDAISSPVNLSSAGSASSGVGPGHDQWVIRKNLFGTPGGLVSMLFPNTTSLFYGTFGDPNKMVKGLDTAFSTLDKKYGPRINR